MEKQHYKLGPKASVFWDPTQPDGSKKVLPGHLVELEETTNVTEAVSTKHIVPATDKEVKEYKAKQAKEKSDAEQQQATDTGKGEAGKKAADKAGNKAAANGSTAPEAENTGKGEAGEETK